MINEVKTNNQQIFKEKVQALKGKEEITLRSQQLEATITNPCSELPELKIWAEETSVEKIHKLATAVKESKDEISRVRFKLQLHISKLQLNLQPTSPPEVREKCEAAIKEEMDTLQGPNKGYMKLFE